MSTNQILIGLGLIIVLAVGSQILASRLRGPAIVRGLAAASMRGFDIPARRPFFETLVQLIISLLLISIPATVTPASVRHLILPTVGLVAVLVLVARPLVAWTATLRTDLTGGECGLAGWMGPRGIASPVARRLGVTRPARTRPLLVGGDPWVIELGAARRGSDPSPEAAVLFVIRASGQLVPVTGDATPAYRDKDTTVLLEPPQPAAGPVPVPRHPADQVTP